MTTTLRNVDGDLALILDRQTLDSLGIDGQTLLEVSVDATGINIRPVPGDQTARVLLPPSR